MLFEQWHYRQGSVERGNVRKSLSESVNAMEQSLFKVNEYSNRNYNNEKRAFGIELEEEGELDKGLRGIV